MTATTTTRPPRESGTPKKDAAPANGYRAEAKQWAATKVEEAKQSVTADTVSTVKRLRWHAMPHGAAVGVYVAGLGVHAVAAEGLSPAQTMAVTALMSAGAVGGGFWKARKLCPDWAGQILRAGVGAATWLTLFAPHSVDATSLGVLVATEVMVAARWWKSIRIRPGQTATPTTPTTLDELAEIVEEEVRKAKPEDFDLAKSVRIMQLWAEKVAGPGGPLPGSSLSMPTRTETGHAFTLTLAGGKQTVNTARGQVENIAGALTALDVAVEDIIIERSPASKSPAVGRFQLITHSPIAEGVNFDGPRRFRGGLLQVGPHADGQGEAIWRLYTPGSMWGGFILGGTGSGKSRVLENLVISAVAGCDTLDEDGNRIPGLELPKRSDTVVWFIDPQGGGSSPALAKYADWFVDMSRVDDMLDSLISILLERSAENAVEGWTGFTPSPDRPGILVVIDESHNVFGDQERVGLWAKLAREGRKVGIALVAVSQYPGLVTFGGSEPLRSSVMSGNAAILPITSKSGNMMAGMSVDPLTLPKIPGYGYIQSTPESGLREAPFRNRNTDPDGGPSAADWLNIMPKGTLEMLSSTAADAAGDWYRDRNSDDGSSQQANAERVRLLRQGIVPPTDDDDNDGDDNGGGGGGGRRGSRKKSVAAAAAARSAASAEKRGADMVPDFPSYDEALVQARQKRQTAAAQGLGPDLLRELAQIFVAKQYASTAMLQRHARTTYAESVEAMGRLADLGVVAPPTAEGGAWKVLVHGDDWETFAADTFSGTAPATAAPSGQGPDPDFVLGDGHRRVLDAVRNGHTRPSEIEAATGYKHRHVQTLLSELTGSGHLTKPGYGRYAAVA